MDHSYKNIQKWLIVFVVVILIGLVATLSLIFYSFTDRGTPVNESLQLENAEVVFLQDSNHNMIKLNFANIAEEKSENYILSLLNKNGKVLETMNISIEYLYEDMREYIYAPDTDLDNVYYYKIEKKES